MDNLQPSPGSLTVIIPVYNGAGTIKELVARLHAMLTALGNDFEIVMVNDGSQDNSWKVIEDICQYHSDVKGINLLRNFGQHNAILCGIRQAQNDIIITMDDDLQHPPEEIHKLLEKIDEGYDVVYGVPDKMPHSLFRNLSSWIVKRLLSVVMGIKSIKEISAFRAFRSRLKIAFIEYRSSGVIIDVLLSWATTSFTSVIVHENPRKIGNSNYNLRKLIKQAFLILTGFSTIPLRFAIIIGFTFTFFGFAILVYVTTIYFTMGSIPGFPFLSSIIAIFSGIQLLVLGIFGEYLARIFDRSMDRPAYIIGKVTDKDTK